MAIPLLIDASDGTHVLGSKFGKLITTFREDIGDNFAHTTKAKLIYDEDNWLLAYVDDGIIKYYANQVEKRFGVKLLPNKWGAHVSVIRGEKPENDKSWGHNDGKSVTINYTHDIYTNGNHWWLNVESNDLVAIRSHYGFRTAMKRFHLTIGRI